MKTVKQGDSGEEIAILNNALTQAGYSVKEGMTFTPALRETVVAFQQQRGLEPDGIVGYHTWEALLLGGESESTELADEDFSRGALLLDCEKAALRAVQEVESGSRHGFVAPGMPTILFEGHIFWAQLKKRGIDPVQYAAQNGDILYPQWEKSHYRGGLKEYDRLEKARAIDREAADASASWGMFQVMGFNFAACGEKSVASFVAAMQQSARSQLKLFVRFIHQGGMLFALQRKEWATFARLYNGPRYAENRYDVKLAKAYAKYAR